MTARPVRPSASKSPKTSTFLAPSGQADTRLESVGIRQQGGVIEPAFGCAEELVELGSRPTAVCDQLEQAFR